MLSHPESLICFAESGCTDVRQASSKRRIVCLSIAPTLCSASIVSWTAAIASLRYFLLTSHLHEIAVLDQGFDLLLRQLQHVACCLLELFLFIVVDVRPLALREPVSENRFSPPWPGDPLLNDAAAEIGIHLSFFSARHRIYQNRLGDLFLSSKPLEP